MMGYPDEHLLDRVRDLHGLRLALTLHHEEWREVFAAVVEDLLDYLRSLIRHVAGFGSGLLASNSLRGIILLLLNR